MLGVGIPWQHAEGKSYYYHFALALLEPPKWYNWKFDRIGDENYYPMCWKFAPGTGLNNAIAVAQQHPGHFWLHGNEPEMPPVHGQSVTSPQEYAQAATIWVQQVGGSWGGPGILWGYLGRQWITQYVQLGAPIPDKWTIHIYGCTTYEQWRQQLDEAEDFFASLGVSRPVWVTETNANGDVDAQFVLMNTLMRRTDVDAIWYSAQHYVEGQPLWQRADLIDAVWWNGASTTWLGYQYASYQRSQNHDGGPPIYLPPGSKS